MAIDKCYNAINCPGDLVDFFVGLGVFMICLVRLRALVDEIRWADSINRFFYWAEFIGGFFAGRKAFVNLLMAWGITGPIHVY